MAAPGVQQVVMHVATQLPPWHEVPLPQITGGAHSVQASPSVLPQTWTPVPLHSRAPRMQASTHGAVHIPLEQVPGAQVSKLPHSRQESEFQSPQRTTRSPSHNWAPRTEHVLVQAETQAPASQTVPGPHGTGVCHSVHASPSVFSQA